MYSPKKSLPSPANAFSQVDFAVVVTLNTDIWTAGGLSVSRPGPQRHQQRLPVQGGLPTGNTILHLHHGTPPL